MLRRVLRYGSFFGRATRSEYAWTLGWYAAAAALLLIFPPLAVYTPIGLFVVVLNYVALFIFLATSVRRMHDFGKSGWLLLLWPLASFVFTAWCLVRPSKAPAALPTS